MNAVAALKITRLNEKYNGDNDTIPGAPEVTATDKELFDLITRLYGIVEAMADEIRNLREEVKP